MPKQECIFCKRINGSDALYCSDMSCTGYDGNICSCGISNLIGIRSCIGCGKSLSSTGSSTSVPLPAPRAPRRTPSRPTSHGIPAGHRTGAAAGAGTAPRAPPAPPAPGAGYGYAGMPSSSSRINFSGLKVTQQRNVHDHMKGSVQNDAKRDIFIGVDIDPSSNLWNFFADRRVAASGGILPRAPGKNFHFTLFNCQYDKHMDYLFCKEFMDFLRGETQKLFDNGFRISTDIGDYGYAGAKNIFYIRHFTTQRQDLYRTFIVNIINEMFRLMASSGKYYRGLDYLPPSVNPADKKLSQGHLFFNPRQSDADKNFLIRFPGYLLESRRTILDTVLPLKCHVTLMVKMEDPTKRLERTIFSPAATSCGCNHKLIPGITSHHTTLDCPTYKIQEYNRDIGRQRKAGRRMGITYRDAFQTSGGITEVKKEDTVAKIEINKINNILGGQSRSLNTFCKNQTFKY